MRKKKQKITLHKLSAIRRNVFCGVLNKHRSKKSIKTARETPIETAIIRGV